jgi:heat shock protein HtpX
MSTLSGRAGHRSRRRSLLRIVDLLAMLPELKTYVQHYVPEGEAATTWRRMLAAVRKREHGVAPVVRQHFIRAGASLLASHPTPGRRHQWLSPLPATPPAIVVDPATAGRVEREIAPYAEIMHQTMLDHTLA